MTIYNAIHTAMKAHEHQKRKLDNDLYAAHPLEVGVLLAKAGLSDEVICAGILHDTVEDTHVTLEDIETQFGPIVTMYVSYCSEADKSLSWLDRKKNYIERIKDAPIDVLFIVCADKLTNIKSIYRHQDDLGDALWDKFNAGYDLQKWYYYSMLQSLASISYHPLYSELKDYVLNVFPN